MTSRIRSLAAGAAVLAIAAGGLAASGAAQARGDVSWSVGISAPVAGVVVGNSPGYYQPQPIYAPQPVYVQPAPVYAPPAPVYYGARPVYVQPRPVYIQAPPVYVAPRPVWVPPGHRWGHHGGPHYRNDWRR